MPRKLTPKPCRYCGTETKGGDYCPGHDRKAELDIMHNHFGGPDAFRRRFGF